MPFPDAGGHTRVLPYEVVNGHPKIVAAIPAFNEEIAIGSVVLQSKRYADEVLVIDDGSIDGTAEIARMAGAIVLRHDKNSGKGAAIKTALSYARNNGVGILVFHDGDMQHNPAEIPKVVEPIINGGADVVLGKRWGKQNGMPTYRRVGKRILDYVTAFATNGKYLTDSQSGFRALSRMTVEKIDVKSDGFGIESEMLIRFAENGLRVAEVPVSARYDVDGSTLDPIRHSIQVIRTIMMLGAEKRPMMFLGVPGGALATAGIVVGLGAEATGSAGPFAMMIALAGLLAALGTGLISRGWMRHVRRAARAK